MPAWSEVAELTAADLASALESGVPMQVVDVRAPARVAAGRIDLAPAERFHNIVGSRLLACDTLEGTGIDPGLPVAVVCGLGNDSRALARHLGRLGCDARSLHGGMSAWMALVLPRPLQAPPSLDRLVQFDRVGKGALGYLLVSDGAAMVIDPPRRAEAYLDDARTSGARIVGVADTHVHADYISGGPTLARALGVPYYLHPANAVYPYDGTPGHVEYWPLEDGESIRVGRANVVAFHTPGHTEGSSSFLVDGAVVFTGDFVFVNSVGRPDLAGKTAEWTEQLWESLARARRDWPREAVVRPAHYAGNDERSADRSVGRPFGPMLDTNEALRFTDREAFCNWVLGRRATFPDAYRRIKAVNIGLLDVDDQEADELEVGRNECALGGPPRA